jgi:nitrogen fixation protein NifX
MIRVAFASQDDMHVDMHFGAAERFVVYDVAPGRAELVRAASFKAAVMKGENKDKALPEGQIYIPGEEMAAKPGELDRPPEDKVIEKLDFVKDCAAVYAASIGTSSIKRLMAQGVQPIIVDLGHDIVDLLNEVSFSLVQGGLAWVDRAKSKLRDDDRFARMEAEGWDETVDDSVAAGRYRLVTSID